MFDDSDTEEESNTVLAGVLDEIGLEIGSEVLLLTIITTTNTSTN